MKLKTEETVEISYPLARDILTSLKGEADYFHHKWEEVGFHPSAIYRKDYRYFRDLAEKLEIELLKL